MTKRPVLVDLDELKRLMAEVKLDDEKQRNEYINARWLKYVEWWDWRAAVAKRWYLVSRTAVVVGSALIPALVAAQSLDRLSDYAGLFAAASIMVSLVIVISAGLESLFGWGDIWREKRTAAELIKSEGFDFLQLCGAYAQFRSRDQAYRLFAQNVEDLIRHEAKDYIVAIAPKPDDPTDHGSGTPPPKAA